MSKPQLVRREHDDRLTMLRLALRDYQQEFREDVAEGLSRSPKQIPPKYFYDERGSQLFEQITATPEYYPTRTEAAILAKYAEAIIAAAGGAAALVELGSGSSTKTRLLLDIMAQRRDSLRYIPIDISPSIVLEHGRRLLDEYPLLRVSALICDYARAMEELAKTHDETRLYLFLGSSIGNFTPGDAEALLRNVASAMVDGDSLLLGIDLVKEEETLNRAYNDAAGVTAAFNLNVLAHINDALGGHFELERFRHQAFFNVAESRIEMHLESLENQIVPIDALKRSFSFTTGETINTEYSYKFNPESMEKFYQGTDLKRVNHWVDANNWFALDLLVPA